MAFGRQRKQEKEIQLNNALMYYTIIDVLIEAGLTTRKQVEKKMNKVHEGLQDGSYMERIKRDMEIESVKE